MNLTTAEQMMAYQMVRSAQATTDKGDYCRRPSCSHPRTDHAGGVGACTFALVCLCHTFVAGDGASGTESPAPQGKL